VVTFNIVPKDEPAMLVYLFNVIMCFP